LVTSDGLISMNGKMSQFTTKFSSGESERGEGAGTQASGYRHVTEQPGRTLRQPGQVRRRRAAAQKGVDDLREGAGTETPKYCYNTGKFI